MIMAVKEDCGKVAGPQECAGCGKKIHDKFLLKVRPASPHSFSEGYIALEQKEVLISSNLSLQTHPNSIHIPHGKAMIE